MACPARGERHIEQYDTHSYFHYHHTTADPLDKVLPGNLRCHGAVLTSLAWFLANIEQPIGRAPAQIE